MHAPHLRQAPTSTESKFSRVTMLLVRVSYAAQLKGFNHVTLQILRASLCQSRTHHCLADVLLIPSDRHLGSSQHGLNSSGYLWPNACIACALALP